MAVELFARLLDALWKLQDPLFMLASAMDPAPPVPPSHQPQSNGAVKTMGDRFLVDPTLIERLCVLFCF